MTIYENIKQLESVGQLHSNTLVNADCLEAMKYIADKIGIETSTVNPFKRVACDPQVFGAAGISESLSNVYAPALGLALRKF